MAHTINTKKDHAQIRSAVEKIVVNAGVGRASALPSFEEKILPQIRRDLALLAGQAPQIRRAKKSIAGFKMREGQIVGLRATLRRARMVDFFNRLITIVLPRVRDFSGIELRAVDRGGVLNIGFKDEFVFPEINPEQSPVSFSLQVSVVPKKKSREAGLETFRSLGVPLKKESPAKKK